MIWRFASTNLTVSISISRYAIISRPCPGTFRPQRHFFALLNPRGSVAAALPHPAGSKMRMVKPLKFPVQLQLERLPGEDGLLNHFELLKDMVLITGKDAERWTIREVDFTQTSASCYTALHLSTSHECDAPRPDPDTAAPAASSSSCKASDEDFSYLDMTFLDPGPDLASILKDTGCDDESDCHEDDDCFSDNAGSDFDINEALERQHLDRRAPELFAAAEPERQAQEPAAAPASPGVAPSEAGSRAGQVKTVATDKDLIEKALRDAGRPDWSVFELTVQSVYVSHITIRYIRSIRYHTDYTIIESY